MMQAGAMPIDGSVLRSYLTCCEVCREYNALDRAAPFVNEKK